MERRLYDALPLASRQAARVTSAFAPRPQWLAVFLLLPGVVVALAVARWWADAARAFLGQHAPWNAGDFATLYAAGRAVGSGNAGALLDPALLVATEQASLGHQFAGGNGLAYLNPPFFAALLAPLSWLPFDRAFQLWTVGALALILMTCGLLWKNAVPLGFRWRATLIAGLLSSFPLAFSLRLGQFSVLLMTSWLAAYLYLRRGHDRRAGLALAPLLVKPELLIPVTVFLIWKRRFRVMQTLLPVTLAATAASLLILGPSGLINYPRFLVGNAGDAAHGSRVDLMFGYNGMLGAFVGPAHALRTTIVMLPFAAGTLGACA